MSASGSISAVATVENRTGISRFDFSDQSLKENILKTGKVSSVGELSHYHILRLPPEAVAVVTIEYQNKRVEIIDCDAENDNRILILSDGSAGTTALIDLNRFGDKKNETTKPALVTIIYPFQ